MESGTDGSVSSCDAFVSEETLIPGASLTQLFAVDSYAAGVGGWDVTAGTGSRTYRVTWTFDPTGKTQLQVDQLQGAKTGVDIQWELQSN